LIAGILLAVLRDLATNRKMTSDQKALPLDREKWQALEKYDSEIATIANKLRVLGDKWVDEFARAYLALGDKQHLPNIVQKIIADARLEAQKLEEKNIADDRLRRRRWRGLAITVCVTLSFYIVVYFALRALAPH
jgi:hypothetical protein